MSHDILNYDCPRGLDNTETMYCPAVLLLVLSIGLSYAADPTPTPTPTTIPTVTPTNVPSANITNIPSNFPTATPSGNITATTTSSSNSNYDAAGVAAYSVFAGLVGFFWLVSMIMTLVQVFTGKPVDVREVVVQ